MSTLSTTPRRPARTYTTGPLTRVLRWVVVLVALGITVWILVLYPSLPDRVPTHFRLGGQADEWGPRWSALVLAGVMLVLSLAIAAISTRPRWFNYPVEITERTAQAVYREGERMVVWAGLGMQGIYAGIACWLQGIGGAPMLVVGFAVLLGPVLVFIVRMVLAAR